MTRDQQTACYHDDSVISLCIFDCKQRLLSKRPILSCVDCGLCDYMCIHQDTRHQLLWGQKCIN